MARIPETVQKHSQTELRRIIRYMQGKIIKGIAGFYYVHVVESGVYECKAKGIFRKDGIKPLVGDEVEIEVLDDKDMEGNIMRILPRRNELIRPAVANIDQALVVFAVAKPKPHLNLLDRFLVMMEAQQVPVIICFNKADLKDPEDLAALYRRAGYEVCVVCAGTGEGIGQVRKLLVWRPLRVRLRPPGPRPQWMAPCPPPASRSLRARGQ